jgi:hypothetical protein
MSSKFLNRWFSTDEVDYLTEMLADKKRFLWFENLFVGSIKKGTKQPARSNWVAESNTGSKLRIYDSKRQTLAWKDIQSVQSGEEYINHHGRRFYLNEFKKCK